MPKKLKRPRKDRELVLAENFRQATRLYVGRQHVSTPGWRVGLAIGRALRDHKQYRVEPDEMRRAIAYALDEHAENVAIYRQVMGGAPMVSEAQVTSWMQRIGAGVE